MTGKCGWWARRRHRWLRKADRAFMWEALVKHEGGDRRFGHDAWELFKNQAGQEHWHCECAKRDWRDRVMLVKDENAP